MTGFQFAVAGFHAYAGIMKWIPGLLVVLAACAGPLSAQDQPQTDFKPLDAGLDDFPYPYEVHIKKIESQKQQLELAYMDVKPAEANGKSVLLLHGKNFSGAYWGPTAKALSDLGYRVVIPDQIGFGKSSKPPAYQYSFQSYGLNNRDLLDELGIEKVIVIGHSMGGMVATRFSLMFPERVEKLVLANPIGLEDWKRLVPYQSIEDGYKEELAKTPESIRKYMEGFYFDGKWKSEYDPLLALQAGWAIGPDREEIAWVSALTADMIFTQPVVQEFGDLKMPVLLIIGERDRTALGKNRATPEVAETMGQYQILGKKAAEAIPDAELVALPGIGHVPQYEVFDKFMAAIEEFISD